MIAKSKLTSDIIIIIPLTALGLLSCKLKGVSHYLFELLATF